MSRVLVVEDDADLRELLTWVLTDAGYTVDTVGSGADVLPHLAAAPAVVVLDVMLPEVDGLTLVHLLGRTHPTLPIVVVTAYPLARAVAELGPVSGPIRFLAKPFANDALLANVALAIGH